MYPSGVTFSFDISLHKYVKTPDEPPSKKKQYISLNKFDPSRDISLKLQNSHNTITYH